MRLKPTEPSRYYVHGDAAENKPFQFYCSICDAFAPTAHFSDELHISARATRYARSLNAWRTLSRNSPDAYFRPKDVENCLSDDVAADKRKTKAARSSFYVWLLRQTGRDDPVGELANDSKRDTSFPVSVTSEKRLRAHLRNQNACDQALSALDEALEEFKTKSKTRKGISLALRFQVLKDDNYRCQLCGYGARDGKQLEVDHKLAVAHGGTNERENLWTLCFECNRGKQTNAA